MKVVVTAICLSLCVLLNLRTTLAASTSAPAVKMPMKFLTVKEVALKGLLGEAVEAGRVGRLRTFITDERSEMVSMFSKEIAARNTEGDWKGEHVGKWLYTAARAAYRTDDATLLDQVRRVADYLVKVQEPDGYLGTYSPATRMTSDAAYKKVKTWDVWIHTYMMLGLLELNRYYPNEKYLTAAKKVGDLCVRTFTKGDKRITEMSNHFGLSATVLLEPMIELYRVTGDKHYLEFGETIVEEMEAKPELQVIKRSLQEADAASIVTGKAYQLLWNYVAIAKLYEFTANPDYLRAVKHGWQNVRDYHLTLDGGPWGGIARHTETFNEKGYFSPYGFVETCSTMAWIHLNRELLRLTGEAKYAEEIEKTAYNALLGALDPNGADWCYFIFPNGKRTNTFHWACCKSSGAMALEEFAPLVYGQMEEGVSVNIYTASEGSVTLPATGTVRITQHTLYPLDEAITLTINPIKRATFPLFLRVPAWAERASFNVNGQRGSETIVPGGFLKLVRQWKPGDKIVLNFPMQVRVHQQSNVTHEKTTEVVRLDYIAMTRGPLVYATGLIDGYKREDTLLMPKQNLESLFSSTSTPAGFKGPAFNLTLPDRSPITFVPYYEAGGRSDGRWRLTWMPVAWR